ncbi:MAG: NERD domain-containing protein, partial [Myxococcales bacterium]
MSFPSARKVTVGETPYAHEAEALDFAYSVLPDSDPFHVWALTELLDPSTGRLYELDLLVLGYSALYLVEIKSGPGRYDGDHQEWWRTPPGAQRPSYMDGPLSLCNLKAKVLKSRLQSKMKLQCPYVHPLIFLSAADLDIRLTPEGRMNVVTRKELLAAVQHHKFPGAPLNWHAERINGPLMRDVAQGLHALGLRPRKGRAHAGSYELGELIADGTGYQDRVATHRDRKFQTRARVYLVPQQVSVSVERRAQLRRAAERESGLLWDVREHPHILRMTDYVSDAPLGPTVLFDDFAGAVPLDAFLRHHPTLPFADRLAVVQQVGGALAHCHRKSIFHGAVAPQSVLVRRHPDTSAIDVRLFNFQLGAGGEFEGTQHWSSLAQDAWAVYQAPELRENP